MTPEQELDLRMLGEPDEGDVFLLRVAFPGSPKTYTYAALATDGAVYLTGEEAAGRRRTWEQLVDRLKTKNATVVSLRRAASWEDIL